MDAPREAPMADPVPTLNVDSTAFDDLGVLTSSLVLIGGGDDGSDPELLQTSHELTQPGGGVSGVQMWRMSPGGAAPSASPSAAVAEWPVENDEEAFMYSGSQL